MSGTLTGAKLPKKGKGVAAVRAIVLETGTVGAARRTSTKGSFSLQLPPARYLLTGSASQGGGPYTTLVTWNWSLGPQY